MQANCLVRVLQEVRARLKVEQKTLSEYHLDPPMSWNELFVVLTKRISASVRTQALQAVALAPSMASGGWTVGANDGIPCLFTALWSGATGDPIASINDQPALPEIVIAEVLGITVREVEAGYHCWDGGTDQEREKFVNRISQYVWKHFTDAQGPAMERKPRKETPHEKLVSV
ncbi:MAG: hypothetical protein A2722_01605 [Candidatus Doudnabacteria bacterium RIFCSPHIGHO2_01_FULL_50_11]|uniref:Uncharacterized protein n=1 Tax=Candidatus Doudnabacteria bacterium RIFCSPHIGHO2_01_FULL_50_11 TaxID=1817828 RepID=A0A1F5PEW4_9BACT|nr:MAG: hypothetical protein A2722_01605 [Candidatus Doudnabacteria bacterium RIFCSPHIGHO2_01_FULL_50_11]HLC44304.1 hypothetical protein [Patescibacteria group bacterium]